MIDLHCHILPEIDDGAEDMQEALAMARLAVGDGISTIVATPHLPPQALGDPGYILEQTQLLQEALQAEGLPLKVLPGAEVPALPEVLEHLDTVPCLGHQDQYLLLEIPLAGLPVYVEEMVFSLQVAGLTPVLAHAARSQFAQRNPEVLLRLAERGCPLQLNVDSLLGRNGRVVRNLARRLLREVPNCVLASDAHNTVHRPPLLSPALPVFRRLGGEERFQEVTQTGPAKILAG